MEIQGERQTMNCDECAKLLGVARSTVFSAIQRGQIPYLRVSRRILIPRAAIERLLQNGAIPTAGQSAES